MSDRSVSIVSAESRTIKNGSNIKTGYDVTFIVTLKPGETLEKIDVIHQPDNVTYKYDVIPGSLANPTCKDGDSNSPYFRSRGANHETIVSIHADDEDIDSESMETVNLSDNKKINFFI